MFKSFGQYMPTFAGTSEDAVAKLAEASGVSEEVVRRHRARKKT